MRDKQYAALRALTIHCVLNAVYALGLVAYWEMQPEDGPSFVVGLVVPILVAALVLAVSAFFAKGMLSLVLHTAMVCCAVGAAVLLYCAIKVMAQGLADAAVAFYFITPFVAPLLVRWLRSRAAMAAVPLVGCYIVSSLLFATAYYRMYDGITQPELDLMAEPAYYRHLPLSKRQREFHRRFRHISQLVANQDKRAYRLFRSLLPRAEGPGFMRLKFGPEGVSAVPAGEGIWDPTLAEPTPVIYVSGVLWGSVEHGIPRYDSDDDAMGAFHAKISEALAGGSADDEAGEASGDGGFELCDPFLIRDGDIPLLLSTAEVLGHAATVAELNAYLSTREELAEERAELRQPAILTWSDFLAFSFVNTATLGTGDVAPTGTNGRLLVGLQMFNQVYIAAILLFVVYVAKEDPAPEELPTSPRSRLESIRAAVRGWLIELQDLAGPTRAAIAFLKRRGLFLFVCLALGALIVLVAVRANKRQVAPPPPDALATLARYVTTEPTDGMAEQATWKEAFLGRADGLETLRSYLLAPDHGRRAIAWHALWPQAYAMFSTPFDRMEWLDSLSAECPGLPEFMAEVAHRVACSKSADLRRDALQALASMIVISPQGATELANSALHGGNSSEIGIALGQFSGAADADGPDVLRGIDCRSISELIRSDRGGSRLAVLDFLSQEPLRHVSFDPDWWNSADEQTIGATLRVVCAYGRDEYLPHVFGAAYGAPDSAVCKAAWTGLRRRFHFSEDDADHGRVYGLKAAYRNWSEGIGRGSAARP